MGIRAFFHKIKMGFVRAGESSIPYVNEVKRYGNSGEDEFTYRLCRELPSCKIKRNVAILTPDGNAEIDCLVLHHKKLFAIEVKRWKGYLTERDDGFLQEKTDRWTGETHTKLLKSPFKQLGRAIYLLRKQIPIKAWVNAVVFFEGDELESVSAFRIMYGLTAIKTLWIISAMTARFLSAQAQMTSLKDVYPLTTYTPMLGESPCIVLSTAPR